MRLLIALLTMSCCSLNLAAAEIETKSKVDSVTVFLSGAEVTRTAKVELLPGDHTVVLGDVPASAVTGSIRVEGKATGKLSIISVDTQRTYLQRDESRAADADRKRIEDEIERLRDERAGIDAQRQAADTQAALIANLANLPTTRPAPPSGPAGAAPADDWQRILNVILQGTNESTRLRTEANSKLRDLDRKIADYQKQLAVLAPPRTRQTEVRVNVNAGSPLEADLIIRYQVPQAGWSPLYDARLDSGSKTEAPKLLLSRRASITQRTGESWDDVALQLSTARPSDGSSAPDLKSEFVDYEQPRRPEPMPAPMVSRELRKAYRTRTESDADQMMDDERGLGAAAGAVAAAEPVVATEQTATLINAPFEATYNVPGRVSIADSGKAKRVVLLSDVFDPTLSSRTVPRFDSNAYLYARFKLADGSPLLPGAVYLFRDGTFVGTASLPMLQGGSEHDLGFGLDDQVKVRHAVLEDKSGETGLISTSRVDSRNFKVSIKNLHDRAIDLKVIDRVPVSRNEEIKVSYTGSVPPTDQDLDDQRGVFSFVAKLEPDQEKVIEYGYKITWPASKSIIYGP